MDPCRRQFADAFEICVSSDASDSRFKLLASSWVPKPLGRMLWRVSNFGLVLVDVALWTGLLFYFATFLMVMITQLVFLFLLEALLCGYFLMVLVIVVAKNSLPLVGRLIRVCWSVRPAGASCKDVVGAWSREVWARTLEAWSAQRRRTVRAVREYCGMYGCFQNQMRDCWQDSARRLPLLWHEIVHCPDAIAL